MSSEPGRVKEIIEVDLARPRSRTDEGFAQYYERILGLISDAK
jgi:NitT/TauT family transport system ATP-binding protein